MGRAVPELYWKSLCKACGQLKTRNPQWFACVVGVGVTTQRNSMINMDKDGTPLRPAVIWLDQRKATPIFGASGMLNFIFTL